jgi:uncharacterized membrane protein (UPF0127 family)
MTRNLLYNDTKQVVVADSVEVAGRLWSRFVGLMGRKELVPGSVLVLEPSNGVHTFFMRFEMDALFVDKEWRVLHIADRMKPWRVSRIVRRSRRIVELPGGTCRALGVAKGDQLSLREPNAKMSAIAG